MKKLNLMAALLLTVATLFSAAGAPHRPCLLLTQDGVAALRAEMGKNPLVDKAFAEAKAVADKAVSEPVVVPQPLDVGGRLFARKTQGELHADVSGRRGLSADGREEVCGVRAAHAARLRGDLSRSVAAPRPLYQDARQDLLPGAQRGRLADLHGQCLRLRLRPYPGSGARADRDAPLPADGRVHGERRAGQLPRVQFDAQLRNVDGRRHGHDRLRDGRPRSGGQGAQGLDQGGQDGVSGAARCALLARRVLRRGPRLPALRDLSLRDAGRVHRPQRPRDRRVPLPGRHPPEGCQQPAAVHLRGGHLPDERCHCQGYPHLRDSLQRRHRLQGLSARQGAARHRRAAGRRDPDRRGRRGGRVRSPAARPGRSITVRRSSAAARTGATADWGSSARRPTTPV